MTQPTEEQIALTRSNRLLEESERKLAFINGKIDATIDNFVADPENIEMLRHLAWARTGMKFGIENGKVHGAPPGWPEGINEQSFVEEWTSNQKNTAVSKTPVESTQDSPTVVQFKSLLE